MGNCFSDIKADTYKVGGASLGHAVSTDVEAAQAQALLTGALAYSSWLNISVSATHLVDRDVLSKSDPLAVLYEAVAGGGGWHELGRTEVITDNLNPVWVKSFKCQFNFERLQEMKVLIVDVDKNQDPVKGDPSEMQTLGYATFHLSQLVTAKERTLTKALVGGKSGTVHLTAEELSNSRELITFSVVGSNLLNVEVFSKSDPFLQISRLQGDTGAQYLPVYKTEVRHNNLNPTWAPISIKATQLNNGDPLRPLRFSVYDYESGGKHRIIGYADTTAAKLRELCEARTPLQLSNPSKPGPCGTLAIQSYKAELRPTFLDYVQAGIEICFSVAVDFTGSNGDPRDGASLHFMNPSGALTKYEEAIHGVGRVIEFYDSDRTFPAYGFGGARGGATSHCFHLNGDPGNPMCGGVAGICAAYRQALTQWALSGPTLFAPIINAAIAGAQQPTPHLRYNVLLILTDGAIMDMEETINAIITASTLPLSILIVGIGGGDFSAMEALDSDKARLSQRGRVAERDIVQFVEFRKFADKGDALAAELLAELPGQFLEYCRARNIMPPSHAHPAPTAPALPVAV